MPNRPTITPKSAAERARRRWDQTTDPDARTAATAPARRRAAERFRKQVDPDRTLDVLHELAGGRPVVVELADARRRQHMSELAKASHRRRRAARLQALQFAAEVAA